MYVWAHIFPSAKHWPPGWLLCSFVLCHIGAKTYLKPPSQFPWALLQVQGNSSSFKCNEYLLCYYIQAYYILGWVQFFHSGLSIISIPTEKTAVGYGLWTLWSISPIRNCYCQSLTHGGSIELPAYFISGISIIVCICKEIFGQFFFGWRFLSRVYFSVFHSIFKKSQVFFFSFNVLKIQFSYSITETDAKWSVFV